MFSKEFLINEIPTLNLNHTGTFALSLMEDLNLKHLPVIQDGRFAFLVSKKDIFDMENSEDTLDKMHFFTICASEETSILDILRIVNKYHLTLLPIINSEGEYKGAITLENLMEKMGDLCNTRVNGAIIALELNPQDYYLSQIIHLIEQNEAKVLNLFSYIDEKTSKLILILKIDLEDASNVIRSLERFNYPVKYYAQKEMLCDETMRDRVNELMYYLEL